jgi:hypothetical protein
MYHRRSNVKRSPLLGVLLVLALAGCGMLALAAFDGCGSTTTTTVTTTTPAPRATCLPPRNPSGAGEYIHYDLCLQHHLSLVRPTVSRAPQCVDVSVWNDIPNFSRAGLRCVIIQTNDGVLTNPFYWMQAAAARAAHLRIGVYVFTEGISATEQASIAARVSRNSGYTLGGWVDAEKEAAYPVACSLVRALSHYFDHVGVYSSPGIYRGGHCEGYDFPAEWGNERAYPLPGYSRAETVIRQWCGDCTLPGFGGEVDRDEALGILRFPTHAPAPHVSSHRQLERDYAFRAALRGDLARHRCTAAHHHPYRACAVWDQQLRQVQAEIRSLHKRGVW